MVNVADFSITMVNNPRFLVAMSLVEVPIGFYRRIGRLFSNSGDKLLAGYAAALNPTKRAKMMHGLSIASQNTRGRTNRLMDLEYEGMDSMTDAMIGHNRKSTLSRVKGFLQRLSLFGFEDVALWSKAAEVLPAQSRLFNDIEKLYKLRRLITENEGPDMTKARWKELVEEAGFGRNRYEHADEYQGLGLLQDGVLEQIDVWLRDTNWQENIFDFDAFRDDMRMTEDINQYRTKGTALRAMKNQSWNAASKTNLERRGQEIPTGATKSQLHALASKLTGFPTMWSRFNTRLMATGTLSSILGTYLGYLVGETMYTKMLDIARGRNPHDIMKEWEEDPIGSFLVGTARLPFLGWSSYLASSVLESIRTWSGREFGNNGIFGYKDGHSYPALMGQFGGTTSMNTYLGAVSAIVGNIISWMRGGDIPPNQMMKMAKAFPVPFRPLIMASIGFAMAEEELRRQKPSFGLPYDNRFTNGWLKGVDGDSWSRIKEERLKIAKEEERERKMGEAQERTRREKFRMKQETPPIPIESIETQKPYPAPPGLVQP